MLPLLRPVNAPISSTFQDHKNRRPPSVEPGTDYACAVGTPVVAPYGGVIVGIHDSSSGPSGRALMLHLDCGGYVRSLHLSRLLVRAGQRVSRGQVIAYSGGSANGSERGVGPHVHETYWPEMHYPPTPGVTPPSDFEVAVWNSETQPADTDSAPFKPTGSDDMIIVIKGKANTRQGGVYYVSGGNAVQLGIVDGTHPRPDGAVTLTDEGQISKFYASVSGLK